MRRLLPILVIALVPVAGTSGVRRLPFDERVALEARIARVYDRHRDWPGTAGQKPPFESRVSRPDLERQVEGYLRASAALQLWGAPIRAGDLAAEVQRMVRSTRSPQVLAELFAALDRDPYLVAECLARKTLALRLVAGARQPVPAPAELPSGWREPELDAAEVRPAATYGGAGFHGYPPDERRAFAAVWTGAEMIVWGGNNGVRGVDTGGRYDPALDFWVSTSTQGAPSPRSGPAAIWTGRELIVWGGWGSNGNLRTGGRYDPATDSWRATSTGSNCPPAANQRTCVWSGSEMLVWQPGGGAGYDPVADAWRSLSSSGAPLNVGGYSAVFASGEMIVWGGSAGGTDLNTGARYDPVVDRWRPTTTVGAPAARFGHAAVWTGTEMIVWGGRARSSYLASGGRYDPVTDTWRSVSMVAAPAARWSHTTVWSGTEMIIWGGSVGSTYVNDGGRYDPAVDAWLATTITPLTPTPRVDHVAVWTGTEMIVWGGVWRGGSGGRYDPSSGAWRPTFAPNVPTPRVGHSAVWTGSEMIVWGGWRGTAMEAGGRYDPATNAWTATSIANAPSTRSGHAAVWTGTEMVAWGGWGAGSTGGRYDPAADAWRPTSPVSAPAPREYPATVFTGTEMIVWGGSAGNTGGRYDPARDTWQATSTGTGCPPASSRPTGVWTGTEMIAWGGSAGNTGGRYDPVTDSWRATSTGPHVPVAVYGHTAVWTGSEMIVWASNPGGRYDPVTDTWRPTSTAGNFPSDRSGHSAVWTGSRMVMWGGESYPVELETGSLYDPVADTWTPTSDLGSPCARHAHTAVWTGRDVIVWGGLQDDTGASAVFDSGGVYDPARDLWDSSLPPLLGDDVLAGKVRSAASPGASITAFRADGLPVFFVSDAFPQLLGGGVRVAAGDVSAGGPEEVVAAPGPAAGHPALVTGFDRFGTALPGLLFAPYASGGYGANVGTGRTDGAVDILTGPGPSTVFGPHVRGFWYVSGSVMPIAKVSFYAYTTLRYGVSVGAFEHDADGYDEILTGAGPGAVFGPHVRAFNYDRVILAPVTKINFFAYGTLRYGVEIGAGDVDADGYGEVLTGPGPSAAFASQVRGFDADGGAATAIGSLNAIVFSGSLYGANVVGGDVDTDGWDEIACGAGPDPAYGSRMRAFDYDGSTLVDIPALDIDVYGVTHGTRVAVGGLLF